MLNKTFHLQAGPSFAFCLGHRVKRSEIDKPLTPLQVIAFPPGRENGITKTL